MTKNAGAFSPPILNVIVGLKKMEWKQFRLEPWSFEFTFFTDIENVGWFVSKQAEVCWRNRRPIFEACACDPQLGPNVLGIPESEFPEKNGVIVLRFQELETSDLIPFVKILRFGNYWGWEEQKLITQRHDVIIALLAEINHENPFYFLKISKGHMIIRFVDCPEESRFDYLCNACWEYNKKHFDIDGLTAASKKAQFRQWMSSQELRFGAI